MEYKLEDLFTLQMGKTPSRNNPEYWDSPDQKWISISDLSKCGKYISETKEYISDKAVEESGISLIPENTVIMSFKLSIGKVAITAQPMYSNEAIMSFRDKRVVELLPDYVYYLLLGHDWEQGTNKAVMGKTLNKATLSQIKVRIHPLETQHSIVSTLDKLQSIITHRRQQLAKLDELIKARFVEMFGEPILNEKGWNMVTIGDIVTEVKYGTSKPAVEGGKYPYLRMNNLTYDGHLDLTNLKMIDIPDSEIEKCIVHRGDVLFNRTNSIELVGKTCVFDKDEDMVIAGYIIRVRLKSIMLPIVLSYFMNTDALKKKLRNMAKGAVNQANINAQEFKSINIYLPPIELQTQFADFVKQVDKSKVAVQKALDEAQLLFDSLMQEYFG